MGLYLHLFGTRGYTSTYLEHDILTHINNEFLGSPVFKQTHMVFKSYISLYIYVYIYIYVVEI